MRALAISAMKGSRLSQQALSEIVREIEAKHEKERTQILENAFEYKQRWTAEMERCARQGLPVPTPLPHPDDIIINFRTGAVRTEGPLDELEKTEWDKRLHRRDEAQDLVSEYMAVHRQLMAAREKRHKADQGAS